MRITVNLWNTVFSGFKEKKLYFPCLFFPIFSPSPPASWLTETQNIEGLNLEPKKNGWILAPVQKKVSHPSNTNIVASWRRTNERTSKRTCQKIQWIHKNTKNRKNSWIFNTRKQFFKFLCQQESEVNLKFNATFVRRFPRAKSFIFTFEKLHQNSHFFLF